MVGAARYELIPLDAVVAWQGAILLKSPVEEPRSLVVTVHGYRADGEPVVLQGRRWRRSTQFDAEFCYLPTARAGQVVPLPALRSQEAASRLTLVVRPFGQETRQAHEVVSTLCFEDLDPVRKRGHTVVTTHQPEAVDV